jgi:hypothetical protein
VIARAEGERVRLEFSPFDPQSYIQPANELIDAEADLRNHRNDLTTWQLRPFRDRVAAAEVEFEELFVETVNIKTAEFVLRMLEKAIVDAKVSRGDFARLDRAEAE